MPQPWSFMCVVKAEVYPEVQQVAIALDKTDLEPHQSLKGKWLGTLFANLAIVHLADVCLSLLVHWCHVLAFFFCSPNSYPQIWFNKILRCCLVNIFCKAVHKSQVLHFRLASGLEQFRTRMERVFYNNSGWNFIACSYQVSSSCFVCVCVFCFALFWLVFIFFFKA